MLLWESLLLNSSSTQQPGVLYSWGDNSNGKTGLNITGSTNTIVPTIVDFDKNWQKISAGSVHSLAIADSKLYSFGSNGTGSTGLNTQIGNTLVPTQVGNDLGWTNCSAGLQHSLAIKDTILYAAGAASQYETGLNNTTTISVFTEVSGTGWTDCSAGLYYSSLGIKNGQLYAWGNNTYSQLGSGNTTTLTVPTQIGSSSNWSMVSMGTYHALGVDNSVLYSWGLNVGTGQNIASASTTSPTAAQIQTTIGNVTDVTTGDFVSIMISGGELYSCGLNAYGATGQNTITGNTTSFTKIGTSTDWTHCSSFAYHVLAIRNTELYAWGYNLNGRTGLNTTTGNTLVPTRVGTDTGWTACSAGFSHSLGIKDGYIFGWGSNSSGRTGLNASSGDTLVPTQIGTSNGWTACSAGYMHSLAINNGLLYSWGDNGSGRTGLNTTFGSTLIPTQVGTDSGWTDCSAGSACSLAIRNGILYSFGENSNGSTGLNTTSGSTLVPTQVTSDTDWLNCFCGNRSNAFGNNGSSFATRTSGDLYAWGDNSAKLGLNTTSAILIPTYVDAGKFKKCDSTTHSLFISTDDELFGCGSNSNTALGININTGPSIFYSITACGNDFTNTTVVEDIFAGDYIALVISNGNLYYSGAQASFLTNGSCLRFLRFTAYSDWTKCTAGGNAATNRYGLAIRNKYLYAAGFNSNGRTGLNTTSGNSYTFVKVNNDIDWDSVKAGVSHTLGIKK